MSCQSGLRRIYQKESSVTVENDLKLNPLPFVLLDCEISRPKMIRYNCILMLYNKSDQGRHLIVLYRMRRKRIASVC